MKPRSLDEHFALSHIKAPDGCWEWIGTISPKGYGVIGHRLNGKSAKLQALKFSYQRFIGEIPDGLIIEHLCQKRDCVNPDHLKATTKKVMAVKTRYLGGSISGRAMRAHVAIAEKALGKRLPKGAEVHHVNRIPHDNRNENLVICEDHKYHGLLHRRQRVVDAGGNPDLHWICRNCGLLPLDQFTRHWEKDEKLTTSCHDCRRKSAKVYRAKKGIVPRPHLKIKRRRYLLQLGASRLDKPL